jgi:hypothetical protein
MSVQSSRLLQNLNFRLPLFISGSLNTLQHRQYGIAAVSGGHDDKKSPEEWEVGKGS